MIRRNLCRYNILRTAGLLALAVALVLDVVWLLGDSYPALLLFLNLLPGLVLLLAGFMVASAPRSRCAGWGLGCLSLLALLVCVVGNVGARFVHTATSPVTDSARYPEILAELGYPNVHLLDHFPARVPPDATGVSFYYLPNFLQGGTSVRLCYRRPGVERVLEQYRPQARQV